MTKQLDINIRTERLHLSPDSAGRFRIIDRHSREPLGRIALRSARHSRDGGLELSYAIAPGSRGRGFCTEAAAALVGRAFRDAVTSRIYASTGWLNVPSRRVLTSLGMHQRDISLPDRDSLAGVLNPTDSDLLPYARVEYEVLQRDWELRRGFARRQRMDSRVTPSHSRTTARPPQGKAFAPLA